MTPLQTNLVAALREHANRLSEKQWAAERRATLQMLRLLIDDVEREFRKTEANPDG